MHWKDQYFTAVWASPHWKQMAAVSRLQQAIQDVPADRPSFSSPTLLCSQPWEAILAFCHDFPWVTLSEYPQTVELLSVVHRAHVAQPFCEWTTSFPFVPLADCCQIGSKTERGLWEHLLMFVTNCTASTFLLWAFILFRWTLSDVPSVEVKMKIPEM